MALQYEPPGHSVQYSPTPWTFSAIQPYRTPWTSSAIQPYPWTIQCNTALSPGYSVQYSPTPWTFSVIQPYPLDYTALPPGHSFSAIQLPPLTKYSCRTPRTNWSSVGGSRTSNGIAHSAIVH